MIIHKLIARHLFHRDDPEFYLLQARDAIHWLQNQGVRIGRTTSALDLGCGHGLLGLELSKLGCSVTYADEVNMLHPDVAETGFRELNIDQEELSDLGTFDLVVCSNVYEHLEKPDRFLSSIRDSLNPGGHFYLSWTNWLSPWGGHEFSPFHYLGPRMGPRVYDTFCRRPRLHTPFQNLYPTSIGRTLRFLRRQSGLTLVKVIPRYYPEFCFLTRIPLVREFLTWNCGLLLRQE